MIAPVLLVVVAALVIMVARRQHASNRLSHVNRSLVSLRAAPKETPLERTLREWHEHGLLDAEEIAPILRYEAARAAPRSRIPLVAEAVGYVGSALVFTAIALLIGRRWDELAVAARVAVLAVPALAAAAAGWWVGSQRDEAFERMGSVLWLLSSAAFAGALVVVFVDVFYDGDPPQHGGLLFVSALVALWTFGQYALRRLALQQLALFASLVATVFGVVNAMEASRSRGFSTMVGGLALWGFGVAWTGLGLWRRLMPDELARFFGPAAVLIAAQVVRVDARDLGLWLGLGSAAAFVAIAVARADLIVLFAGTVGLFQWSPQVALHYLADSIGTEATLIVVGALLIAGATVFTRLFQRVRAGGDVAQPPGGT